MAPELNQEQPKEEKSFFSVIVHSFFIIPFLIAVFCVLLFTAMNLLTREKRTAYDYLNDVKIGGATKRWQGAFELAKILANSKSVPNDTRFSAELVSAFKNATHDDNRVRQYLALAMGRTGNKEFVTPLTEQLANEKEENLPALIYSLGMLKSPDGAIALYPFVNHKSALIRSVTTVALGNIANRGSIPLLRKGLNDSESNVQWGAAIALAGMGDNAGHNILSKMLNREYYKQFPAVDSNEQNNLILAALEVSPQLNDANLNALIKNLSETDQNMNVRSAALKALK